VDVRGDSPVERWLQHSIRSRPTLWVRPWTASSSRAVRSSASCGHSAPARWAAACFEFRFQDLTEDLLRQLAKKARRKLLEAQQDGLRVREHDRDQHRADAQGQDTHLTGGRGAQRQRTVSAASGPFAAEASASSPSTDRAVTAPTRSDFLFGRAQRLAEEQLVQLHEPGRSAREMPTPACSGAVQIATFLSDFGTAGV
jgi:hypothetical protein